MKEPEKLLLRKKDICLWTGITSDEYEACVKAGVIRGAHLRKDGRLYFWKEHIREQLIRPVQEASAVRVLQPKIAVEALKQTLIERRKVLPVLRKKGGKRGNSDRRR